MAINFLPNPVYRFKDTNDVPLVGGLVFTYDTGTTNKQTVWKDKAKVAAHTNPIILDNRGEAEIWYDGTIDLVPAPVGDTDPPSSPLDTVVGLESSIDQVSVAQSGLVLNLSFEEDADNASTFTNWTAFPAAGATILVDALVQSDGSNSVEFIAPGSGGGRLESDFIAVTANSTLVVNGMIISNGTAVDNLVKIAFYDKDKVAVSTKTAYDGQAVSTTTWTEFGGRVTATSISVWAKVELHGANNSAGTVHFDRITLMQERDTDYATIDAHRGMALNSMFDRGIQHPRHWTLNPTGSGTVTSTTFTQLTGTQAVKFVSADGTGAGNADSEFIPISGGHILVAEAIIESSTTTLTNTISFRYFTALKSLVSTVVAYTNGGTSTTAFARAIASDTAPSTARYVIVRIAGSTSSAGTVYFDRIHVTDEMDDSLKYTRVKLAASLAVPNSSATNITFDSEVSDDWKTHDNSTNPERINVPVWAKFAKAKLFVNWIDSSAATTHLTISINHTVLGLVSFQQGSPNAAHGTTQFADTGWVKTLGAGYFSTTARQDSVGSLDITSTTFLEVEFRAK